MKSEFKTMNREESGIKSCARGNIMNSGDSYSNCNDDLIYSLLKKESLKNVDVANFIKHQKEYGINPVGTCAICGRNYTYGGNNPRPVVKDKAARCCSVCHGEVVESARIDAACSEKGGFVKGIQRNFGSTAAISPHGIIRYVRDAGTIKLILPSNNNNGSGWVKYDIVHAEFDPPIIAFKKSGGNVAAIINAQEIHRSFFAAGNEINIELNGDYRQWRLCANYDEAEGFHFRRGKNKFLKPHEIRACMMRAAHLEDHANHTLGINEDSSVRIYVRFHTGKASDRNNGKLSNCHYHFRVTIGSNVHPEQLTTYGNCIVIPANKYPSMASSNMSGLTLGVIQELLPVDQRHNLRLKKI